ncbi:unnamed protein product [Amoebophrya sp. A25]|nr:unnamed protein product [Amoebophrya sp. A25]|eukprot:GSA25T00014871001.1
MIILDCEYITIWLDFNPTANQFTTATRPKGDLVDHESSHESGVSPDFGRCRFCRRLTGFSSNF